MNSSNMNYSNMNYSTVGKNNININEKNGKNLFPCIDSHSAHYFKKN